ncbi:E2F-associated phosphoprotein-like [Dendronephthya gigantea]|uniref:E2F-associated phosphoprotein-like n=1 Tax=Dendronephthya gigantea TaxID=151771 RepID=UPI00106AB3A1|nr:E2F-associated phosphoprotein-like [Dendronephthya gigantea]
MERFPRFGEDLSSSSDFYLGVDSSSEDEGGNSSGDEIDQDFAHYERKYGGSDSDSFEKEMEQELNEEFAKYSKQLFDDRSRAAEKPADKAEDGKKDTTGQSSSMEMGDNTEDKEEKKSVTYDEIYFSSGSEDDEDNVGGLSSKSKERRMMKSDDELLYDPNMDSEDEKWVKQQRREYQQVVEPKCGEEIDGNKDDFEPNKKPKKKSSKNNFTSDAMLACPACLTTLCVDCQRHDIYKQQFRAMFVMNCKVVADETLRYEDKKQKKKSSKKNKQPDAGVSLEKESELYNPVQCTSCNTEVAVFDKDEVYHFFNVVESLP